MVMRYRGGGIGHKSTRDITDKFKQDRDPLDIHNATSAIDKENDLLQRQEEMEEDVFDIEEGVLELDWGDIDSESMTTDEEEEAKGLTSSSSEEESDESENNNNDIEM